MKKILLMLFCVLALPFFGGCDDTDKKQPERPSADRRLGPPKAMSEEEIQKAENKAQEKRADMIDQWLGKWNGPEGTYMKIEKSGDGYGIIIKDLDKEERYLGVRDFLGLRFHRGDREESIHLGPGRDTGMKWLQDKPYCLIVKKGEAYCRDKLDD